MNRRHLKESKLLKIDANCKNQHCSMNINVADLVMEDSMSVKSMESVATSDEYEFVNEKGTSKQQQALLEPPMLKIANNGNLEDLQNNLREVCIFIRRLIVPNLIDEL